MKKHIFIIVLLITLITPAKLIASGMVVYDGLNHIESLLQTMEQQLIQANTKINSIEAVEQTRNLIKQYEEMKKHYTELVRQAEALTGKYGYGRWLKGPARLLTREYRPENNEDLLGLLSEGRSDNPKYKDNRNAWVDIYLPKDPKEGRPEEKDTPDTHQKRDLLNSSGSLYIIGGSLYDDTKDRVKTIEDILDKIDETESVKESLDLLNANTAELHRTLEKLLLVQALLLKHEGVVGQGQVNDNRDGQEFNKW